MLRSLNELLGYELMAKDGHIGTVDDFFFNDEDWTIRYLVVDTGPWIFERKVLISPQVLLQPVWETENFPVDLSREEVKTSPNIDVAKPVSREYEEKLHEHYRWPAYWSMSAGVFGRPYYIPPHLFTQPDKPDDAGQTISHLRSVKELSGYRTFATDGLVGSVKDFIIEDEEWRVCYLVIATSSEDEGDKQVLLALDWIDHIDVASKEVSIDLTEDSVRRSPAFNPDIPVNLQFEEVLYDYHGRPKYWQVVE
jgi:sporulation protein YlmC with PRC-barrel domain